MKNKRDAQNHKVGHDYSKFTNKKTEAWKSLTYTQSHTDGNKAETQMWFFSTPCLIWKNKSKVQILAQFLIFFWENCHMWSISIYMDYLDEYIASQKI